VTEESEKVEKEAIDIVVPTAENVGDPKRLNEDVGFKIVPEGSSGVEKAALTAVCVIKKIGKEFGWIFDQ
jgi:hypothetical protein